MGRFNPRANPLSSDPTEFTGKAWGISTNKALTSQLGVSNSQAASFSASQDYLYPVSTTATVTLPLATSFKGKQYKIKKSVTGAYVVTIACSGSDLIDGAASTTFSTTFGAMELMSDGVSTWHKIGTF